MGQESKTVAIIGAGASACLCAYFLLNKGLSVILFDKGAPLRTLLPTGGGRCNLAHSEYDFKELAKNYPRGEKFLYSIFSRFATADTIEVFEKIGVKTYVQENGRIFPESNSAKDVRDKILEKIVNADFVKEEVINVEKLDNGFKVSTAKAQYYYDSVILAIGGHSSYKIVKNLGLEVLEPMPALVGLKTKEVFNNLSGTVVKGAKCNGIVDDLLFTHFGVSGPLIYTVSSLKAFEKMPYKIIIDLSPEMENLQTELNNNPHKEIKNILNKYLPQRVVSYILRDIDETTKAHRINGKIRDLIEERIHCFYVEVIGSNQGEETVTAGGIVLDEINPKTMEVKKVPNLFAIGEVLNIDGFCGGFNLQNAWSTAYVCAESL